MVDDGEKAGCAADIIDLPSKRAPLDTAGRLEPAKIENRELRRGHARPLELGLDDFDISRDSPAAMARPDIGPVGQPSRTLPSDGGRRSMSFPGKLREGT